MLYMTPFLFDLDNLLHWHIPNESLPWAQSDHFFEHEQIFYSNAIAPSSDPESAFSIKTVVIDLYPSSRASSEAP